MQKIDAITVWTGSKYTKQDADFCFDQLVRQNTFHRIYCISDKESHRSDVQFVRVPSWNLLDSQQWWYKIAMFSDQYNFSPRCFYTDLDVLFVKPADILLDRHQDFVIINDFNRSRFSKNPGYNSSMILWNRSKYHWLCTNFQSNMNLHMKRFRGDQDYITNSIQAAASTWPSHLIVSYKWEWMKQPQFSDPVAIVFHGNPKPKDFEYSYEKIYSSVVGNGAN